MSGSIHEEHPFRTPEDRRDRVRQFRGRLAAPVTVLTAGGPSARTGITVSSLVAAEGEPGSIYFLLGPDTDFADVVRDTGRFVVHVLGEEQRALADVFAGVRPSPGGMFRGLDVIDGQWGPVIAGIGNLAFCSFRDAVTESYSSLVSSTVDRVEIDELTDPLLYYRGSYRTVS